jgi:hypothetical protein
LQFLPNVGEYLPIGASLVAIHGGAGPSEDTIRSCVRLGRSRTMYQDPLFGIRKLVDVASQALSPAVNQPTTAVIVIDRLEELLLRIARRPQPTGPKLSIWPSPRSRSTGRRRRPSADGWPRPTTGCSGRSPSICVLTSLGITLFWGLLQLERSSPTIPWLLLGPIREGLAEDIARCRSGQAMRNRSLATSKWVPGAGWS